MPSAKSISTKESYFSARPVVHTAHIRRTKTLWLVVTKGLFCRRLRSERWIRMRAGLGEAHAEELRRPVLVFRVSSLPLRSTAWDPSSGFAHTLQVTGPAACFPQEFALVMSSDRRGPVRLGPGPSPPLSRSCAGSVWTPSPPPAGYFLRLLASRCLVL